MFYVSFYIMDEEVRSSVWKFFIIDFSFFELSWVELYERINDMVELRM